MQILLLEHQIRKLVELKKIYYEADTDYHYLEEHLEKEIFPIIDRIKKQMDDSSI